MSRHPFCGLWLGVALVCGVSTQPIAAPSRAVLADAVMRGDTAAIHALLTHGAEVNAPQGDGMTALHWAALHDDVTLAKTLIRAGADVSAVTRLDAYTPLLIAAANGSAALVGLLLESGADAKSATANGMTALMSAATSGSVGSVTWLLDRGADPNAKEFARQETPLMFAAVNNRAAVIKTLLAHGADPSAATTVLDLATIDGPRPVLNADRQDTNRRLVGTQGGMTALLFAARQGHMEAAQALLEGGANIDQVSPGDKTSPLLIATINGDFDLARVLLDRGADPNLASAAGATPLYTTLNVQWIPRSFYPQPTNQAQQQTPYLKLMTLLLEHGADPNARLTKKLWYSGYNFDLSGVDETGATPFWRAAQATDVAAMRLLVDWGADPRLTTSASARRPRGGRGSAAGPASSTPPKPSAQAMPGQPSRNTSTRQDEGVNALLAAAGDGWFGNFHVNAPGGWMPSVKYLVEDLGFDVNAADDTGYTPLHYAAARGDDDMILYFVSKGADVKAVSEDGVTTADMANGHDPRVQPFEETVRLLEKLGSKNNHHCLSCGRPGGAPAPLKH